MNLRNKLRHTSDKDLVGIIINAKNEVMRADNGFRIDGGVDENQAVQASEAQLTKTVAYAVVREKTASDFSGGHLEFEQEGYGENPKRQDRIWGARLTSKKAGS